MPELETQLRQIWPLGVDVAAMAPETVDREQLKDELVDDAMNAYDEREEQFGDELMRYLERSILLQVIDNRWREHLYDMDYLREGIHLRGFAQIDPLVAYKNEGFSMFEELMHSIWEEFSKLIFHVEVEIDPSQAQEAFAPQRRHAAGGARLLGRHAAAQPSALQPGCGRRFGAGRSEMVAAGGGPATAAAPRWSRRWSRTSTRTSAATTPAGAARARSTRSATAPERRSRRDSAPTPSASSSGPSTSGTSTRSWRCSIPRSSCTRCGGCARAARRRGCGQRGPRGGAADDRAGGALRGRHRVGGRSGCGADQARLALGRGRLAAGEDEMAWMFELRDDRIRSWRPFEDRAEALRAAASNTASPPSRLRPWPTHADRIRRPAPRRRPRADVPALGLP